MLKKYKTPKELLEEKQDNRDRNNKSIVESMTDEELDKIGKLIQAEQQFRLKCDNEESLCK